MSTLPDDARKLVSYWNAKGKIGSEYQDMPGANAATVFLPVGMRVFAGVEETPGGFVAFVEKSMGERLPVHSAGHDLFRALGEIHSRLGPFVVDAVLTPERIRISTDPIQTRVLHVIDPIHLSGKRASGNFRERRAQFQSALDKTQPGGEIMVANAALGLGGQKQAWENRKRAESPPGILLVPSGDHIGGDRENRTFRFFPGATCFHAVVTSVDPEGADLAALEPSGKGMYIGKAALLEGIEPVGIADVVIVRRHNNIRGEVSPETAVILRVEEEGDWSQCRIEKAAPQLSMETFDGNANREYLEIGEYEVR